MQKLANIDNFESLYNNSINNVNICNRKSIYDGMSYDEFAQDAVSFGVSALEYENNCLTDADVAYYINVLASELLREGNINDKVKEYMKQCIQLTSGIQEAEAEYDRAYYKLLEKVRQIEKTKSISEIYNSIFKIGLGLM